MGNRPPQLLSRSLDPFVSSLYKAVATCSPGDLVTYEQIELAMGLSKRHGSFRPAIQKWKRLMLTDRNIYVVCEANVGYRLCKADEHLEYSARLKRQAVKRTGKALAVLMHTTDSEVSPALRRVLDHERIKTALTLAAQKEDVTRHRRLLGAPEQLPKILGEATSGSSS